VMQYFNVNSMRSMLKTSNISNRKTNYTLKTVYVQFTFDIFLK